MRVLVVEAPQRVGPEAKRKMTQKLTEAVDGHTESTDDGRPRECLPAEPVSQRICAGT
jgi:hypothetical protein